jgi:carbon-monoxide dehydrogenase medium subunit
VPVREFHLGPYETVVAPDELRVELRVPIRPGSGSAYEKVARRVGDWSVAAAGVVIWLDSGAGPPTVAEVGIGLAAVGAGHFVATEAEDFLRGQPAGDETFARAGQIAAQYCVPSADPRGPVDYKRHLTGELTTRALRRAAARGSGRVA